MAARRTGKRPDRTTFLASDSPEFLSRDEALKVLRVKAATLYTYVSRGMIRSIPIEGTRNRLFSRDDVERLVARAEGAVRWDEPIVDTQITRITPEGLFYRGRPAVDLMRSGATFEAVAMFLWFGSLIDEHLRFPPQALPFQPDDIVLPVLAGNLPCQDVRKVFSLLVLAGGLPERGLSEYTDGLTARVAQQILQTLAGACGYLAPPYRFSLAPDQGTVADTVTVALTGRRDERISMLINAALVLCADFELAPGTFAARVAASAGADLYGCIVAGISAHAGVLTGRGGDKTEELLIDGSSESRKHILDMLKQHGRNVYGFNHQYFSKGDPRAHQMLELARQIDPLPEQAKEALGFLEEARERYQAYPGMAVSLVALCLALGLPRRSAVAIWVLGRVAGQIAHVLEQRVQGFMIRPRAQFGGSDTTLG